jgi:2-dehydro-3-deoxygalactonokinase
MERLIGVDWGTSNLRAFRFDAAGGVVERRDAPFGVQATPDGDFEAALERLAGDWRTGGGARWLLCGMIGSRQGWREAAYAPCPTDGAALAKALTPLTTRLGPAWIVPGVSLETAERVDVMRGEETQILGAVEPGWSGVVIAPGTHSKWATIQAGRISGFRTFMTGELFALLKTHSILGRMIEVAPSDPDAFALGVLRALDDPAITSLLFSARAEALMGRIAPPSIESYLSGLLIGTEVRGGLTGCAPGAAMAVIGAPRITALMVQALDIAGRPGARSIDGGEAAARGLWRIGQALAEA